MKRWPINKAYFWERAPFFRVLLPLMAGIVCYEEAGGLHKHFAYLLLAVAAIFITYTLLIFFGKNNQKVSLINFILINVAVFLAGYSLSYLSDIRNNNKWFGRTANSGGACIARIMDAPAEREKTWKLQLSVIKTINDVQIKPATGDAFVYIYKGNHDVLFQKGDTIMLPDKWQPIKNSGNPFEFDYAGYCRRNNLFYQQFLSLNDIRLYAPHDPNGAPVIERSHDWCMKQLGTYLPDPVARGLIQAMLLGDEVNLDEHLRQSYAETGIIHIIAISGGNVTIFFIVISALLFWLKSKKHLWVKYLVALPLVWFYVLMAGAPPSAIRAALMFSLLAFGIAMQKNNNSLNQLFATAALLLCVEPFWLYSAGFQLSFVAVLSLILFYKHIYKWAAPTNRIVKGLWATVSASLAAEILVAPLVIYYFHIFPVAFIVANVAAYLFMGIVLIMGMSIVVVSFMPPLAKFIGLLTTWLVTCFDWIVDQLQKLNPDSFRFLRLTPVELFMLYILIACIVIFFLKKQKTTLYIGLGTLCILLLSLCKSEWITLHQKRIVVYNTGRTPHVELINGKHYAVLYSDTSGLNKKNYVTKPAHTYWGAWQCDTSDAADEISCINNKTVLVLGKDIFSTNHFPVNYLIVTDASVNPEQTQQIFHPQTIVLAGACNRGQLAEWKECCREQHIALHIVANDGAFVLN